MGYRITGLSAKPFRYLYGLSNQDLESYGAKRYVADNAPGYPDRIEMRDAGLGESLILVNHTYQPAKNAYHGRHAIFVLEGAENTYDTIDIIPEVLRIRPISLRAFDKNHEIIDADLIDGSKLETLIRHFFDNPQVIYLHAHNAKRGCYAGRIDRV